jgi:hypothetical protein
VLPELQETGAWCLANESRWGAHPGWPIPVRIRHILRQRRGCRQSRRGRKFRTLSIPSRPLCPMTI